MPRATYPILIGSLGMGALTLALGDPQRRLVLGLLVPILNGIAAGFLFRRAARLPAERSFAALFGAALALHAFWGLAWLLPTPWTGRDGTVPGLVLQTLGPVLQAAALVFWPRQALTRSLRWRECLDAVIFTSALSTLFWFCGLGTFLGRQGLSLAQEGMQIFYFVSYALLMGIIIFHGLNRPGSFSGTLGWVFAALATITVANLVWIPLALTHPEAGWHLVDALAIPVAACYLLAALAPLVGSEGAKSRPWTTGHMLAPYVPLFLALPVVALRLAQHPHQHEHALVWLSLGMLTLVLGRQLIALWDLRRFAAGLEGTVRSRTQALEELQALLLKTQKMNLLATLGAGLAHDMNNLLAVVNLSLDMVREDAAEGRAPRTADLAMLQAATAQVSALAAKLSSYARQGEPSPQVFDLNQKLRDMLKLLKRIATQEVEVSCDLVPGPLALAMDPLHLEQIVLNLVINARDAMPGGGTLVVATGLQGDPDRPGVYLEITDDGTGIPAEVLPRLFEPFFTTKEAGKGTGLGLASVKAIAEACGADIQVRSEVGQGTAFRLRFPPAAAQAGSSAPS